MRAGMALLAGAALAACSSDSTTPPGRTPAPGGFVVDDKTTCADLGLGAYSYAIDPPVTGTYDLDGHHTITLTTDGVYVDWSTTLGIDAVIIKGGPAANAYVFDPEATHGTALSAPMDDAAGQPHAVTHVDLCYDYELGVTASTSTALTRTYAWSIDMTSPVTDVVLGRAETYLVPYTTTVTKAGYVDSDWVVGGTITITNPAPIAATVVDVVDLLDDTLVRVDCGLALPTVLPPFATLRCTSAAAVPDASVRANRIEVQTAGAVGPGTATDGVRFADTAITVRDTCVDVSDSRAGSLGTTCETTVYNYALPVGPYCECSTSHTIIDTATYAAADTCATGADTWTVNVALASCEAGCTLTPGYWKTHSLHGPAPYDATWAQLPAGADTAFFKSGLTYHEVLWTPSSAGAYYTLARAYIAAYLNWAHGAWTNAIASTFSASTAVFQAYTPLQIAENSTLRAQILEYAADLDAYNNGVTGPGHCTE